jgi:hypothetical protein
MDTLVAVHGFLRWLVLLAALGALGVALASWLGSAASEKMARQAMLAFVISLDIQVLLGIFIYIGEQRWAGGGRQFQFEHPILMLVALAIAHVAAARARRIPDQKDAGRLRALGCGLSLLLIVIGIPWR